MARTILFGGTPTVTMPLLGGGMHLKDTLHARTGRRESGVGRSMVRL